MHRHSYGAKRIEIASCPFWPGILAWNEQELMSVLRREFVVRARLNAYIANARKPLKHA